MPKEEELINEVRELLTGEKLPISEQRKIMYDKKANQFVIKIPKPIADAAELKEFSDIKIIVNPNRESFEEAKESHFIIYAKEKTK